MYSKILVPLDGSKLSEQILPFARTMAEAFVVPVELLLVSDPDARPLLWPEQPRADYLEAVGKKFFAAPLRVTGVAEMGKPAEVIIDHAKSDANCLVAMATHGVTGLRRWLLGSVASKVVQSSENPLLLIHPVEGDGAPRAKLNTVFVPLDGSRLAERVLPHVIALAKAMELEVHLARIYTPPADTYVIGDGIVAQGSGQLRAEIKAEAETYLQGQVEQLRAEGVRRVIASAIEGDPASEIIDLGLNTPNNLIAMATHGRSGIGRWVLGSVAEKVVQQSRDPVLLVRVS